MSAFLPYGRQLIEDDDVAAVVSALRSDWLTTGPRVEAFEVALAAYCGARHAVVCSSGTAALHLAYAAARVGPGQRVVTSAITFVATASAARLLGADVTFADVEHSSANVSAATVAPHLDERVTILTPVHFGGQPADMEALAELCRPRGIRIVEDACHALGASYVDSAGRSIRVGSCAHSDMTVFSFHPVKHLTTGEGGAVTTNDNTLAQRLRLLRNHGLLRAPLPPGSGELLPGSVCQPTDPWFYAMVEPGFNYRITDVQCALGNSQLQKVDRFIAERRAFAVEYESAVAATFGDSVRVLVAPSTAPGCTYHLMVLLIDFERHQVTRAEVMSRLRKQGVGTQVHYIPVHLQPYYRAHCGTGPGDRPGAEAYYRRCLSVPLYPGLPSDSVGRVVKAVRDALDKTT